MIGDLRVLAVIPARGGSKRVPGKNLREVAGKPLIAWTIDAARRSKFVDEAIVSSDDLEIVRIAQEWGATVPFVRDQALGQDESTTVDVVLDAIRRCPGFDLVVVLQPTSPLRNHEDIDTALLRWIATGTPTCVSVCEVREHPMWMFTRSEDGILSPVMEGVLPLRGQLLPPVYVLNGAIYIATIGWLTAERRFIGENTFAFVMPRQRSIDLDTEEDFRQLLTQIGESENGTVPETSRRQP